ncbi:MAG: hypothetical protein WBB01_03960 [Phormidesmis sp.]
MTPAKPIHYPIKPLLAGVMMSVLVGILLNITGAQALLNSPLKRLRSPLQSKATETLEKSCASNVVESVRLSREQLAKLLTIPERDSKTRIREIVQEPYCQLADLDIRAGVKAEREAYPLEFDPDTALVILYENDEYAGYRFKL